MKLFGKDRFPFVRQPDSMDCGTACLAPIRYICYYSFSVDINLYCLYYTLPAYKRYDDNSNRECRRCFALYCKYSI